MPYQPEDPYAKPCSQCRHCSESGLTSVEDRYGYPFMGAALCLRSGHTPRPEPIHFALGRPPHKVYNRCVEERGGSRPDQCGAFGKFFEPIPLPERKPSKLRVLGRQMFRALKAKRADTHG